MFVAQFECRSCSNPLDLNESVMNADDNDDLNNALNTRQEKAMEESFIVLQATHPELMINENRQNRFNHNTEFTHELMNNKLNLTAKSFEILSGESIVEHPLCLECADELIRKYEKKQAILKRESIMMDEYIASLKIPTNDDIQNFKNELKLLELEESNIFKNLKELELDDEKSKFEYEKVIKESQELSIEETRLNYNELIIDLKGYGEY